MERKRVKYSNWRKKMSECINWREKVTLLFLNIKMSHLICDKLKRKVYNLRNIEIIILDD